MSVTAEILLTLTESLESMINQVLRQDQASLQKLARMQGKVICFELTEIDLSLYLFPHNLGVQVQYIYEGKPDTTLRGSPLAFVNMGLGDSTRSLFRGEVRISGDIELGQHFKRILDKLDIDWEEWLSHYTGDLVAFKAGSMIRQLNSWGESALKTLQLDSREYLQEEGELVPRPAELKEFADEINQLRDQVARLDARLQRLQKQLNSST
jgi:ubiquinone biosynthesis protein UbiJ